MGLVMLVGIVVSNAIVLVDAINLLRRERRMSLSDAVTEAGRLRLRPILMTTTTTVLGLLPLAVGIGLSVSTLVTLVLVPSLYVSATGVATQLRARLRWSGGRSGGDRVGERAARA
jgi:HAE1 family hydrophobic/amphiphilic exporter-1